MKKFTFAALAVPLMWVLLLLLLFSNYKIYAQERMVLSGIVKSADGMPLEGVTVWQKDSDNGTQTNETGYYTLQVSNSLPVTFEYLGYKTQTVKPAGPVLNVTLQTDDDLLDEVVINAGYYSVKDKERTGSISKITAKEIGQQPVANPLAAMQGRMAGVNITQSSGTPGGGFDIQIRGRNSLRTEGNAPLYIVDGVPYQSQSVSDGNLSAGMYSAGNISPLNSINPNDIESIEVLKDADATAIYGSRGSNGVVLITTKKGNVEKTTFSFQSTTSISTVSKFMELMNTQEYLKMRRDAFANDGITEYPANAYDVNGTWDQNRYTDWQKEFIGGKAIAQNTQFSIGGGGGQTNYLFSASNRKEGTVYIGDFGYKRTNFLLNVNHRSRNNKFFMNIVVNNSRQDHQLMASDPVADIFLAPNAPSLYDEEKQLNWELNTFTNPLAKLNAEYVSETNDFLSQINAGYNLSENLKISMNAGFTKGLLDEYRTTPSSLYNPVYKIGSESSILNKAYTTTNSWVLEPQLNWSSQFEKGRVEMIIGATFEEKQRTSMAIKALGFTTDEFILNASNAKVQQVMYDRESLYRYGAVFGRLNYIHNQKYIFNLTGRRDGSSRFGDNNRFANFGAVGTAWLFSKEKFFENSSWITFGKLRASYGITGSDLIGDYQYLNTYGISSNNYNGVIGLEPMRLYNPDFSWETNKKFEIALETEFFKGRIAPSVSFYKNRSSNQLVGIPLPGTTGFSTVQENLQATVENRGWEFLIKTLNIDKKQFQWQTYFNLSVPKNKLLTFPNLAESTYANQYEIGQPITIRKMYNYTGINKETGLYEVEDVNADGIIDSKDRTSFIDIGVKYHGGIGNSITCKNWKVDFLWQFVKQTAYTPDFFSAYPGINYNRAKRSTDYFTINNPDALYQMPTSGKNSQAVQAYQNYKLSNAVVMDASYIRLKTVQIQYSFNVSALKGNEVSVYVQGYNLWTLTKFWGNDPETVGGYLPALRTLALGINVNL